MLSKCQATAETLCVAYTHQYGIETVIARPCHVYGPTLHRKIIEPHHNLLKMLLIMKI